MADLGHKRASESNLWSLDTVQVHKGQAPLMVQV